MENAGQACFIWPLGSIKGILRYLQSSVSARTFEDTYTGDGKW